MHAGALQATATVHFLAQQQCKQASNAVSCLHTQRQRKSTHKAGYITTWLLPAMDAMSRLPVG
jgi:hypothetical protein